VFCLARVLLIWLAQLIRWHFTCHKKRNRMFFNSRGVIAEQYSDLQAIPILENARRKYQLPAASPQSTFRAVFQAVEIALLNLADLFSRAAAEVGQRQFGSAAVKMSWASGFHRVLVKLSALPQQLALGAGREESATLRISDSPALCDYLEALYRLDTSLEICANSLELDLERLLAEDSLDRNELRLLHLLRVCNHQATIWEYNLSEVYVPATVSSYVEFIAASKMREAVYDRVLAGDTYFTQFRGLHQIPEILCAEINDRLEYAIMAIDEARPHAAYEHLRYANILSAPILAALPPMTENLVTSDYHKIRENLGLTSGSHSVNLHYHLFRDLYQQLAERLTSWVMRGRAEGVESDVFWRKIRDAISNPDADANAFSFRLLANECLELRSFVQAWRDEHLQLPRNNLGGSRTKSLTGSVDAIKAVKGMRDAARVRDPMRPLARACGVWEERDTSTPTPVTEYLESAKSFDNRLADATGLTTQQHFPNVQNRVGVFANQCPFVPPPQRLVGTKRAGTV
jgi:tryptophan 2,3-dioxygenase